MGLRVMDFMELPWSQLGAGGILALAILMLLRGLIVPRNTVDKMIQVYEERISEKSEEAKAWKSAWEVSQEGQRLKDKQLDELLEVARTTQAILKALPAAPFKVSE